jgi:hypothetical protein
MKAILEFNLEELEDRQAHLRCIKSTDMAIALFDIIYNIRKDAERGNDDDPIEYIYKKIHEVLDEQGIVIDELIS